MQAGPDAGVTLRDRRDAGQRLAERLGRYRGEPTVVVGIPRGSVVVAHEVARHLGARLEVVVIEKVSSAEDPGHALGGVAAASRVLDLPELQSAGHSAEELGEGIRRAESEAERRERAYRGGRGALDLSDRTVVLVLEGIVAPVLARAAVQAIRARGPRRIVLATGVCLRSTHQELRREVDEMVVLREPEYMVSVGEWYREFPPVDDAEISRLLRASSPDHGSRSAAPE